MNKSFTYLYPLVQQEYKLTGHEFISNTYAFHEAYDDCYTISYKFSEPCSTLDSVKLCNLDKTFRENATIIDVVDSEDKLTTSYTIVHPDNLRESFSLIEEGSYSKLPEKNKYIILTFLNRFYPFYEQEIKVVKSVLFKDPNYRKQLSLNLGYTIPEDVELSSKMDRDLELFTI